MLAYRQCGAVTVRPFAGLLFRRMRDDRGGHFVKSKTDTPEYLAPGIVVVKIVIFIVLPSTILIIVTVLAKLKFF